MGQFAKFPSANVANITVSDNEPTTPSNGDIWLDTSTSTSSERVVLCDYQMNETAGTVVADSSANAYHATSDGTTIVDGLYPTTGKAQQGGGAGSIVLPAGATLAGLSEFEIEIYFRKDAITGDGAFRSILNQYLNTSDEGAGLYFVCGTENYLKLNGYFGGAYKACAIYANAVNITPVVGTVYKAHIKYDGAMLKCTIYTVNTTTGALTVHGFGYIAATGALGSNLKPLTLLARNDGTEKSYFTVDRLRITTAAV